MRCCYFQLSCAAATSASVILFFTKKTEQLWVLLPLPLLPCSTMESMRNSPSFQPSKITSPIMADISTTVSGFGSATQILKSIPFAGTLLKTTRVLGNLDGMSRNDNKPLTSSTSASPYTLPATLLQDSTKKFLIFTSIYLPFRPTLLAYSLASSMACFIELLCLPPTCPILEKTSGNSIFDSATAAIPAHSSYPCFALVPTRRLLYASTPLLYPSTLIPNITHQSFFMSLTTHSIRNNVKSNTSFVPAFWNPCLPEELCKWLL
jgi:hypothetical protein